MFLPRLVTICPGCASSLWTIYHNRRTVKFPRVTVRMTLPVYRCRQPACPLFGRPYRSEMEGRLALEQSKYSLHSVCLAGRLFAQTGSLARVHRLLAKEECAVSLRSIPSLVEKYEWMLAGRLEKDTKVIESLKSQGCAILDVFRIGIPPYKDGFCVVQDLVSSTPLKMRQVPHIMRPSLAIIKELITDVGRALPVPVIGFTSDSESASVGVISELLMHSGKGPARYCHISYGRPFRDQQTSEFLSA